MATVELETNQAAAAIYLGYWALPSYVLATQPGPLPVGSWRCFAGPVQHLRGGPLISNLTREPCIRSAHAAQDRQNTVGPEKGRRLRERGGVPEGGRPLKRGTLCVGGGLRRPSKGAARP